MSAMVFGVKGRSCAFDMKSVVNVQPYAPTTPIPGAPPGVHGVGIFNGSPVLVADLALLFGFGVTPLTGRTCLLFIRAGEDEVIGVLADSVAVLDDAETVDPRDGHELPQELSSTMIRGAKGDLAVIDPAAVKRHLIGLHAAEEAVR